MTLAQYGGDVFIVGKARAKEARGKLLMANKQRRGQKTTKNKQKHNMKGRDFYVNKQVNSTKADEGFWRKGER